MALPARCETVASRSAEKSLPPASAFPWKNPPAVAVDRKTAGEQACKPGSVVDDHLSGTPVAWRLVRRYPEAGRAAPYASLFGLAPGGVYL